MPLAVGEEFAGYAVKRQLGAGGMGEVYLAKHPRLPRLDALKILPPNLTQDENFRQRFNREADLAATLWHPHIVGVHDRGEYHGQLWISMDFVDGTDASRLLRETHGRGMPLHDALEIVDAVAEALDYAHGKGLLHRDVKPANILVAIPDNDRRRILLTDFGIARQTDEISGLTVTNMTIGTVSYASPEQLTGKTVDGRSDQYSLAVTSYELLTGARPFEHSNPAVVIGMHLSEEPPRLGDRLPALAVADSVFARALSKQPTARFATCRDFATAVRAALTSADSPPPAGVQPTAAAHPRPTDEVRPDASTQLASAHSRQPNVTEPAVPSGRRWWTFGIPAILTVLLLVFAAFSTFEIVQTREAAIAAPRWQPYVDAGKNAAIALTTINYETADQDVQRVLDIATGTFHDDFRARAEPFKKTVREAKSVSEGTVGGAGLEFLDGDSAKVLVAVTVKTSNVGAPTQEPRSWRMRITVNKIGETYKAANVEFVP